MASAFSTIAEEYDSVRRAVGLFDRSDRGMIELRGKDRLTWLHNLVSNAVKTLDHGSGTYAFALDVKGRIQFDLNILVTPEGILLDIDRSIVPAALRHLDMRLITEDVQMTDATARYAWLGVSGPAAANVAARIGIRNLVALPALAHGLIDNGHVIYFRHDFSGMPGLELIVPISAAATWWDRLAADPDLQPAGFSALNLLRIDHQIPWIGAELDDRVLPAETGQLERAVSYHKGCYLGQEVVERMRSHNVLAKRLVSLAVQDGGGLTLPGTIHFGDQEVGRLTSLVEHPAGLGWIGLGYLKSATPATAELTCAGRSVRLR
jgi:folate-binding protein YgfZ